MPTTPPCNPHHCHRPTPRRAALQGYKGWFTKPRVLHAWLDKHAATLGDRLVVFIDGSDVMWGGCDTFEREYARIAARHAAATTAAAAAAATTFASASASGPPIVFSAELGCDYHVPTPPGCAAIPAPPAWAATTPLHADLGRWHNCAAPGAAPCTEPPSYRFLNSGAFAGTAAALHRMLAAVLAAPRYPYPTPYYLCPPCSAIFHPWSVCSPCP